MATAFTHALVGASLGQGLSSKLPRARLTFFFAVAAVLPDLDIIAFNLGIPYEDALGHRGLSHSLSIAVLLAPLFAFSVLPKYLWSGRHLSILSALFFLALGSHGFLDAFTDAGLGIGFFIPFSNERYFFSWRPLVTPSVSPKAFFNAGAIPILKSEFLVVWLPVLVASSIWQGGRFLGRGEKESDS